MRRLLLLFVTVFTFPVAFACTSGGGGGSGITPDPGSGSGTLDVSATVNCVPGTGGTATCPVQFLATVYSNGTFVPNATVQLGPHGGPAVTMVAGSGAVAYSAPIQSGLAAGYDLSVVRGGDSLTGVVMASPDDYRIAISPDPPIHGQAADLSWTPSGEPGIYTVVLVLDSRNNATFADSAPLGDVGRSLPASAFPSPGSYQLLVARGTQLALSGGRTPGRSKGSVQIIRSRVVNAQ